MPDDTTAPAPFDAEALQRAIEWLQPPQAATQAPSGADEGQSSQGWLGHLLARIGNAEAGGPTGLLGLTRDQSDTAGLRAMLASGAHMLAASGPSYTPKDFGTVLASGIEGAMQSRQGSEQSAFTARGASQQLAQQAFQNRIAAIKEAIPLLQLQQRASLPNPFAQGGDGKPGTSITAAASVPAYGGAVNAPPMPAEYEPYFQEASKATGIPVEVLKAQAAQESGFNPDAKGAAGEVGLFQIKPDTARKPGFGMQGVSDPAVLRDPRTNIMFGAQYLKARAGNADLSTPAGQAAALQAYNGGGDKNYVANVFRYMPPGGGGGGGTQVAAATPQPAAPAATTPPWRVQVATADTGTKTDATPAPAPPPAYATAPTREAATLQAAATKQPVMIQGGDGGTVMPDGSFRSAPPPATTAPPVVPGQPRDITGLKDEDLSLPEFQQRYRTPLAPDAGAVKVNPQVQADRQAAVAAAQKSVTQAQQGMRAAEQDWTVQRDDKSLQARSAAQQRLETAQQNLQTAQQNANKLSQDAETETVKNRQAAQQEQDKQLAATYKDLRDRAATAALKTQEGQQQLAQTAAQGEQQRITNKEAVVNAANQKGYDQAVADQHSARNVRAQVQGFRALSDAIEQPGWIQTTKFPGSEQTIAEKLQQAGIKLDDTGAVQLLRGGITNLTRTLREGLPMGALSDRDLSFIERMGPTEWMDRDTRTAATAYLEQAFAAREKFSSIVQKEMARGKNYADAVDVADAQVKPFVPTVPDDLAQHWTDRSPEWTAAKQKWATDNNVRPGSLYDFPDGRLVLAKKPAPAAAPALAVPR